MLTAVLFALATLPPLCRAAAASDPVARLGARAGDEVSVCVPQATLRRVEIAIAPHYSPYIVPMPVRIEKQRPPAS